MPHSGGGGSHGGGSHGGGHGGGSSRRVSNTYFRGAHRYVYYYNRRPYVYYSTSADPNPKSSALGMIFFGLIWTVMIAIPLAMMITFSKGGPLPLDYDTKIMIQDDLGIIENETALRNRFEEFQKETGITFAVMALTPETAVKGRDCETQSYNAYVSKFYDECHWLIYYVGEEKDRSDDWEWNLMCGDNCTRVLGSRQEKLFTDTFHRNLLRDGSFDSAIIHAIDQLQPDLKGGIFYRGNVSVNGEAAGGERMDLSLLLFMGVFIVVGVAMLAGGIKMLVHPKEEAVAKSKAIRTMSATDELREAKCIYCDGIYYIGTVTSCPHCGASLSLSSEALPPDPVEEPKPEKREYNPETDWLYK